jgi:hypothetical protein
MKKAYLAAVLMLTGLCGMSVTAHARDVDAVVVSIPFEFVAGGATLPAGQYKLSRVNPGVNRELTISSYKNGSAFLLPLFVDDNSNQPPTVTFEHVGGKYFLSEINTTNGVYTMPASREMVMLGKANSPSPTTSTASSGGQ